MLWSSFTLKRQTSLHHIRCVHVVSYKKINLCFLYWERAAAWLKTALTTWSSQTPPHWACCPTSVRFSRVHGESPKYQKSTGKEKTRFCQDALDKNATFYPPSQVQSPSMLHTYHNKTEPFMFTCTGNILLSHKISQMWWWWKKSTI